MSWTTADALFDAVAVDAPTPAAPTPISMSGSGPRFVIRVRALRKVSTRGKINVGKAVSMINNDQ